MEQNDSDDESVTPTLPGFVRASKPPALPGFVRPSASRPKKESGADVAAAYRAAVRRPKPPSATPAGDKPEQGSGGGEYDDFNDELD